MIKIIDNKMSGPMKATCDQCGSVFSFEYSDIKRYEDNIFFGGHKVVRYLICPVCKSDLNISQHKLIGTNFVSSVIDELKNEQSKGEQT